MIIYRPPYSENHKVSTNVFFHKLADFLESIVMTEGELFIVGDFNIHTDMLDDLDAIKLSDLLESFSLQQHVSGPTHIHGHILELIITRQTDRIIKMLPWMSDHASVLCMITSEKPKLTVESITYRKWKSVNVSSFNHDLAASDLCTKPLNNLEDLFACYHTTLKVVLDKHAPSKTKIIVKRPRVPWFNEQLRKAKRERRKAERKWRLSKLERDFAIFKVKRNEVNRLITTACMEYYTNIVEENKSNQRKLFKTCKSLFGQHADDGLPPIWTVGFLLVIWANILNKRS